MSNRLISSPSGVEAEPQKWYFVHIVIHVFEEEIKNCSLLTQIICVLNLVTRTNFRRPFICVIIGVVIQTHIEKHRQTEKFTLVNFSILFKNFETLRPVVHWKRQHATEMQRDNEPILYLLNTTTNTTLLHFQIP